MFGFKCKCLICSLLSLWFLPQNEASFTVNNDTEFSITLLQPENGTADEYVQQSHIDYQQMMCQNDSKCETGRSSIPQSSYDNLPQRICMCDDKCPMYNDCCVDADYHNGNESNFSCAETFLDGNIYMKEKCDSTSRLENTNITNYCHWRNVTDDRADIFLSIPVTSKKSNVTYRNLFCALCNDERNFTFWEVSFTPKPSESNLTSWHEILARARARDRDFKVDFDSALIGNFNVNATLPKYLRSRVRRCIPEEFYSTGKTYENLNCSSMCRSNNDSASSCQFTARVSGNDNTMAKPTEVVTVRARNIPFYGFCARIPSNNSAWNLFCRENDTSLDGTQLTYIDQCFFSTTDGKPCLINSNFEPDEYILLDDETIFVYRFNSTFGSSEWSFVSDNSVYVCGTEIPQTPTERWFAALNRALSVILMSISKIFLILYFALFVSTKKMRHPFGKVIFCYSLTLMTMYAVFVVSDHLSSCEIMAAIFHYLLLSCFCWLTVAAYDCWRTVTASVTLTNVEGHSLRRLLCYCCIGWITPLSVLSVAIYFELSPVQSVACALKPGYGKLNKCFIAQQIPFKYFFVYPSSFMFSIMIYFFLRISVHVIFNASTHRNFCIFAKLALVTGIPWTIGLLITFTNGLIIRFIYCVLNSSQGIFIFLALAYDREVIKNKLISIRDCCCKKSDEHENGRVTFTKANTKRVSQTTVNEYF